MIEHADDAVLATAARELHRAFEMLEWQPDARLVVGEGDPDAFEWDLADDLLQVRGGSGRGVLFGVYDCLESLGFMWPCPGTEVAPQNSVAVERSSGKAAPSVAGRCLIIGSSAFLPRLEAWIEWCARNRLNTVFFHTGSPGVERTGASIPFPQWEAVSELALSAAARYGLVVELGGHWLPSFLPRDRFAETPDAFRMVDGVRRADSNFCTSSAVTIAALQEGARDVFTTYPTVDVFHLWADDAGNWCACPECADVSASDQLLRATNAVASVLLEANPAAQLAYLSYLETDAPPVGAPEPNLCLLWAPRKRCYGHDLGDASCVVNEPKYRSEFASFSQAFEATGAQPTRVFEYWPDGILFKSCFPMFASVGRDIAMYRDAGVHTVQALLVGPRDVLGAWPAFWLYARQAWDPDQDVDALLHQFAAVTLGDGALGPALRDLDHAWYLALQLEPVAKGHGFRATMEAMMKQGGFADMEDPIGRDLPALERIEARHVEALALAEPAAHALAGTAASEEATATVLWLRFALARVRAYAARTGDHPGAGDAFDAATGAADAFIAYLSPRIDDSARGRLEFLHGFAWKNVLRAQRP